MDGANRCTDYLGLTAVVASIPLLAALILAGAMRMPTFFRRAFDSMLFQHAREFGRDLGRGLRCLCVGSNARRRLDRTACRSTVLMWACLSGR